MGKLSATLAAVVVLATLAGCAAAPSREKLAERFRIELAGALGQELSTLEASPSFVELSEGLADDAAEYCGDTAYEAGLAEQPALVRAWDFTCSMYFDGNYTDAGREALRDRIVGYLVEAE